MTLKEFQSATSAVPAPALRCAMAAALSVEPARTTDAYRRFYARVVVVLGLATEEPVRATPTRIPTGGGEVVSDRFGSSPSPSGLLTA